MLVRLAAQPAPGDAEPDAELRRQRGPRGGVAECIGRVEHVAPSAEPARVGAAEQEVPQQRFPRGNELVRQHVPGPHLQAAVPDERGHAPAALRPDAEIVLEQDSLPVQQEAAELRGGVELVEQIVEGRNESRRERGAREVPLPVPVGVRDQMKGEARHRLAPQ